MCDIRNSSGIILGTPVTCQKWWKKCPNYDYDSESKNHETQSKRPAVSGKAITIALFPLEPKPATGMRLCWEADVV